MKHTRLTQREGRLAFERKREGLSTFMRAVYLRHLFAAFKGNFKPLTQKQYSQFLLSL